MYSGNSNPDLFREFGQVFVTEFEVMGNFFLKKKMSPLFMMMYDHGKSYLKKFPITSDPKKHPYGKYNEKEVIDFYISMI